MIVSHAVNSDSFKVTTPSDQEIRMTRLFDAPRRLGAALYIPIRWQATGPSGLFPVLDGELELAPLGEHRTQLAISASYTPPLDGFGAMADRALLHRVAESTVKGFLDQVGQRLRSPAGGPPGSVP